MRGWELEDAFQPHVSEDEAKANGVANVVKVRIRYSTNVRICESVRNHNV